MYYVSAIIFWHRLSGDVSIQLSSAFFNVAYYFIPSNFFFFLIIDKMFMLFSLSVPSPLDDEKVLPVIISM